jgi:hypothetical protein
VNNNIALCPIYIRTKIMFFERYSLSRYLGCLSQFANMDNFYKCLSTILSLCTQIVIIPQVLFNLDY